MIKVGFGGLSIELRPSDTKRSKHLRQVSKFSSPDDTAEVQFSLCIMVKLHMLK